MEAKRPECYGDLDKVFPPGPDGLRQVPRSCWDCASRVPCLKQAVSSGPQAAEFREERLARQDGGGLRGFVRRWSRLKSQHRRKEGS